MRKQMQIPPHTGRHAEEEEKLSIKTENMTEHTKKDKEPKPGITNANS